MNDKELDFLVFFMNKMEEIKSDKQKLDEMRAILNAQCVAYLDSQGSK